MSDKIFLKDITLPIIETGENETYSFVQTDSDLETAGDAADAKKTGDEITQLKADLSECETALESKANIDGSYDSMTVGNAKQLTSNVGINDKAPYLHRTAGGANDIGDREEDTIVGGSVIWNQIAKPVTSRSSGAGLTFTYGADGSVTLSGTTTGSYYEIFERVNLYANHVYLQVIKLTNPNSVKIDVGSLNGGIFPVGSGANLLARIGKVTNSSNVTVGVQHMDVGTDMTGVSFKYMLTDLTTMFPTAVADYVYALEQATAGSGIAWLRKYGFFTKDYYPYCEPIFKHVEGLASHKMVGFNQWDEEVEQGTWDSTTGEPVANTNNWRNKTPIRILPDTIYHVNKVLFRFYYDESMNFVSYDGTGSLDFTTPSNAWYMNIRQAKADWDGTETNIGLKWDGERDGEYEAYKEYTYPLDDSLTLRGIPKRDANNDLYYDGDVYEPDGTVTRKYGIVDLGTLSWTKTDDYFYANLPSDSASPVSGGCYGVAIGYDCVIGNSSDLIAKDKVFTYNNTVFTSAKRIFLRDTSYTSTSDLVTALSGKYLLYKLDATTEETADPFQTPQVVDDWGTEEYVYADGAFPIPVGHDTFYAANLKAKLEMAPDSPGDGDGDYVVRQTNGLNEYVKLTKELPSVPTTDGSYHLEVTVASGTPTLTWVADE